jgi:UDP-glucose 4-epimerase
LDKRILITGGCGFIGSNLVHALHEQSAKITVVDDLSTGNLENLMSLPIRVVTGETLPLYDANYSNNDSDKVLVITCDFARKEIFEKINAGEFDVIIHLAANPRVEYSVNYPVETHEVNVHKTVGLFKYAANSNTRVVFSSSCAIYGDAKDIPTSEMCVTNPNSPYGLQKLQCEEYATLFSKLYDMDIVSLRYFNVYGPRQLGGSAYSTAVSAWCNAIQNGSPLRSDGDGTQTRDMVFVGDVVKANILSATRDEKFNGEAINIATGTSISNNQIIDLFLERFPRADVVHAPTRPGDVKHTLADNSKMKELLNLRETTKFKDGLASTFSWWASLGESNG